MVDPVAAGTAVVGGVELIGEVGGEVDATGLLVVDDVDFAATAVDGVVETFGLEPGRTMSAVIATAVKATINVTATMVRFPMFIFGT